MQSISSQNQTGRGSIIIVNYNGGATLAACLQSVIQTISPWDEVIVVDNASSDGSADAVQRDFPDVKLIRSISNVGFAAGNNAGAARASASYLVFLNPDTVVTDNWIEALLTPLQSNPAIGLATSKILLTDKPERVNTCGNSVHLSGLTLCRGLGLPRNNFNQPEEVTAISGAAFAISRALFEQLEGFDEDFFLYMEDTDLSLRACLAGRSCWMIPQSVVYHQYRFQLRPSKIFYQERNRYLMLLKTFRWTSLIVLLPAFLLAEIATWGFAIMHGRSSEKLRAYAWVVSHWPRILLKRKNTQLLRHTTDRQLLLPFGWSLDFAQPSGGPLAKCAGILFNPLFWLARLLVVAFVWW